MKIAAHRGFSKIYPENTMLAFQKAAETGCDEIELDVQLAKDGTVVIIHDETLKRVTGAEGWVKDYTFEELRRLDASGAFNGKYGVNPIPSLEEYFDWVRGTGITTNIELKNSIYYYPGLEEKTISLIRKHGLEERVLFSSFNHLSLLTCKGFAPAIPCGALVPAIPILNPGFMAKTYGLDFFHPDYTALTVEAAADCTAWGIGINVWTVNDTAVLPRLAEWGCRSVITDRPDACKDWLGKYLKKR